MTVCFRDPVRIGALNLSHRTLLAPLAGVSDVPFRRICQEMGAGLTFVEMISATALVRGSRRTFAMLARHADEKVLGVQVTGPSVDEVAKAVEILDREGFDLIDINMGCPVRKVVGSGCGAAFLRDTARISATVAASRAATQKPLSAKFRLGYTREEVNVRETVQRVVAAGVDMFTIHGRTRSEGYDVAVDRAGIAAGIAARTIPEVVSVANGDVLDLGSARDHLAATECDAVMVSRGAFGNPWIFRELAQGATVLPDMGEWQEVVLRHLAYHEEHYGDTPLAAILARKHLLWYATGFPGSKGLRLKLNSTERLGDARRLIQDFAASLGLGIVRESRLKASHDPKTEMDRVLDRGVGDDGL